MELLHLLKYQKKEVEEAIIQNGWELDQFALEEVTSPQNSPSTVSKLEFSEYYYTFDNVANNFGSNYSPGKDKLHEDSVFANWNSQLSNFRSWLSYLRRELELEVEAESSNEITAAQRYRELISERKASEATASIADLQELIRSIDISNTDIEEPAITISESRRSIPSLDALLEFFDRLLSVSLDSLPTTDLEQIHKIAKETRELNHISHQLDSDLQSEISGSNVEHAADELYLSSATFLARIYTYARVIELDVHTESAKIKRLREEATKSKIFLEKLVKDVQERAQKVTVAQEAKYFSDEANKHRNYSWFWLAATLSLAVIMFTHAYNSFVVAIESMKGRVDVFTLSNFQTLQFIVSKVILFSFLVAAVLWLGRIYKAHRHNYVVNRHRTNALNCFNVFVESTSDPDIKNTVLIYAAQCIFTPQATGFNGNEGESSGIPHVVEVVKNLTSSSK